MTATSYYCVFHSREVISKAIMDFAKLIYLDIEKLSQRNTSKICENEFCSEFATCKLHLEIENDS